ncbi:Fbox domain containing protein [Acanthamoeba castellanii str. Neff]|uniref:Fbox domain containing protein n=1 Tax=Acanthamoeba castellanii (strain ATCC 30010 / Neff) TaxID=1257118 RepID=L8H4J2_ACACF|nr:Fbox domain containing protein [Acanthamoeba castellanii str. Neff]ELR19391.1 Fbox domain containing protein [Acanthamoeba castellanii str. Neff]
MESPESYFKSRIVCDEIVTSDVDNEPASPDSTSPSPSSPHAELATCDVDVISTIRDQETPAPSSATQEENGGASSAPVAELPYNYTRLWGLGTLNVFADWMIMKILRLLAAEDLVQLSLVSRAFYIYSDENDLWKDLCIRKHAGDFRYKGTWRRTTLLPKEKDIPTPYQKIPVPGFHSDYLYSKWYRGNVSMAHFSELPKDLPPHLQVPRRSGLTVNEFIEEYVKPNKPVILTDVVTQWPAWKEKSWTREALIKRFPDTPFRVDQTDDAGQKLNMTLSDYFQYCSQTQDEDPIYVFCPLYGDRAPKLLEDYEVPPYFPEDFFSLMGSERPFYRWVVIGGPRSGSPFHLDPFKTSAWNALLVGRKRWVIYPPNQVPPSGVDVDEDEDTGEIDYTGEDPIVWFLEHYPLIKNRDVSQHPIECILEEGEIIYVPTNWWHMVFNLTETVAVTQNFCDSHNFEDVYKDLAKDKEFKKGVYLFSEKMLMMRPDLMAKVTLPKSYWKKKEKYRIRELEKREELRRQEEEKQATVEETEWNESAFWRVPPSLDDLDEEEREALKNTKVHVPPLSLPSSSSESESESDSDSDDTTSGDSGSGSESQSESESESNTESHD